MPVHRVTSDDHFTQLLNSEGYTHVLVDFFADWCGPCKMIAPKLEQMSSEYRNVLFVKVNVDEVDDLSQRYNVTGLPTFLLFESGNPVPLSSPVVGANEMKVRGLLETTKNLGLNEEF
ncbi:thioredoxin [Indivirus ILV1]|uniref:Thioredoxin n=1 Tax=Indivirus ILV1 TaxID=1977633 RepID=A0A1V0SD63_9VIRU|nr:thioredoxin [Indivirus ILV1]